MAMEPLHRERIDKRFGRCVVISATCSPPALSDFVIVTKGFQYLTVVLPATLGVKDTPCGRASIRAGHFQGVDDQFRLHGMSKGPANRSTGIQIEHRG